MKRLFSLLLLTSSLLTGVSSSQAAGVSLSEGSPAEALTTGEQPYYLFQGERIPLQVRDDAVAVAFKPQPKTRGGNAPQYLQLQDALNAPTRSTAVTTQISPLGQQYAIATLPTGTRSGTHDLRNRIAQQTFVETTLPVLSSPGQSETIVLNDELIVSFAADVSEAEQQSILAEYEAEVIRPMLLSDSRYIVRTTQTQGLGALEIANALTTVPGVTGVSPNFVQQVTRSPFPSLTSPDTDRDLQGDFKVGATLSGSRQVGQNSNLLPWQWYISSIPMLSCLSQSPSSFSELATCMKPGASQQKLNAQVPRTDLRIKEVWDQGQKGKGTVVAVIDSLVQWDHPALRDSLHQVNHPEQCEDEVYGWDFSSLESVNSESTFCNSGDSETRMNQDEFDFIQWRLNHALAYSDAELLDQYSVTAQELRQENPGVSDGAIADFMRGEIKSRTRKEFHGTSVSSVIAANTSDAFGMLGVAPQTQILPVRVMGINETTTVEAVAVGLLYAADRGADVINLSLGSSTPTNLWAGVIDDILEANPDLVIVAASGNEDNDQPNYPAAFPDVLSVGASNFLGQRSPYSSFGSTVDVVAPGGDISQYGFGGLLVAGGTWVPELWEGIPEDQSISNLAFDQRGTYLFTQGTSFASPAVAGVVALMKGEDPERSVTREQINAVLRSTANRDAVSLIEEDLSRYQVTSQNKAANVEAEAKTYFLGEGLVDAEAAIAAVKRILQSR